jgi:hypothetical protein
MQRSAIGFVVLGAACLVATCAEVEPPEPCAGVFCSGHGACLSSGNEAFCACAYGYHPVELECVANDPVDPCAGVGCAGHGNCRVEADAPVCDCFPGYVQLGTIDPACTDLACDLLCVEEPEEDAHAD